MNIKFEIENLKIRENDNGICELTVTIPNMRAGDFANYYSKLQSRQLPIVCNLEEAIAKKSNSSNAYLWVLCDEIAKVIRSSKDEVYRDVVQKAGKFDILLVPKSIWEKEVNDWKSRGRGWQVEIIEEHKNEIEAFFYYGTSAYRKDELQALINYVVDTAYELEIPLMQ